MGKITADQLRELVSYDAQSGVMTWRAKRPYLKANIGDVVGGKDAKGYWRVRIDSKMYQVHRLVWLYVHGEWPNDLIDHANGNPSDNRIANLRQATRSQNAANKRRHVNGRSGYKGVSKHKDTGLWQAQIMVHGKKKYLGVFNSPSEAHAAYVSAANAEFHRFARQE